MSFDENLNILNGKSGKSLVAPIMIKDLHALNECIKFCQLCATECVKTHKDIALVCIECAEICNLTIKFKSCRAKFTPEVVALCIHVCQECEEKCKLINTEICQKCAIICRECYTSL
jgi:hypothetical protein